jgi:hypothetical protein
VDCYPLQLPTDINSSSLLIRARLGWPADKPFIHGRLPRVHFRGRFRGGGVSEPISISIQAAVLRVAQWLARRSGKEWPGVPTSRQIGLIEHYDGLSDRLSFFPTSEPASIMPGQITYFSTDRNHRKNRPSSQALLEELERAEYHWALYWRCCDKAWDWLNDHDYDLDAETVDADRLARDMGSPPVQSPCEPRRLAPAQSTPSSSSAALSHQEVVDADLGKRWTAKNKINSMLDTAKITLTHLENPFNQGGLKSRSENFLSRMNRM